MTKPIKYHLAQNTVDRDDLRALAQWLITDPPPKLTMGPLTVEFQNKWSGWLGRKYSVFCNSGSSANLLMFAALAESGRLRNKKVIVPCAGWPTTITPAIQLGFEPIMCPPDPDNFGLDLNYLEQLNKKHAPSAVIFVQVLGVPNRMDELMRVKEKYGFFLMEDACAAMGSSYHGRKIGSYGDMASFSAYFGHQFSTIEGGLISTDDKKLNNLLLMLRSHGWSKDLDRRSHNDLVNRYGVDDFAKPFVFYLPGYNLRPTDLQAFIGIGQLDKMQWLMDRRWANHQLYNSLLSPQLTCQKYDTNSIVCSIHFCALAPNAESRKNIVKALIRNGIETRIFSASNLSRHPFWYQNFSIPRGPGFNFADKLYSRGFFLPNNPSLGSKEVKFISKVVLDSI